MIIIDFETYSPEDLNNGVIKYAMHPSTDIICMAYKVDDESTKLWVPGVPFPVFPTNEIYAFNAAFEYHIWNAVAVSKYKAQPLTWHNLVDVMALANRYTFPNELAEVGAILKLAIQKQPLGKALIKKICVPNAYGKRPRVQHDFTYEELDLFYKYCIQDVDTTAELIKTLPADTLSDQEQNYWRIVQLMNTRGLPIERVLCEKILSYIEGYAQEMSLRVSEITDGHVEKATQVQRIVTWANTQGVPLPNLTAETVDEFLDQDLPPKVKEMLELRQAIGRSSTAKYRKMIDMEVNGRVHGSMQYYGAQKTGRIAGRGIQIHNLPRASVEDPDVYIQKFHSFEPVEDPVQVAKALIRPMICAEEGMQLIVSDYSSIENCILMWYAEEDDVLASIFRREDQYVKMANRIYDSDDIDKYRRTVGKIAVLGCGFGMGPDKFQEDARHKWKVKFEPHEAEFIVSTWRKVHAKTVQTWYKWKDCVVAAIQNPGKTYAHKKCKFRVTKDRAGNIWLIITLATGRNLFYFQPYLDTDRYGLAPGHYGLNPYSKKWSRLALIPGRITENIVQATARDIMMQGLHNLEHYMPEVSVLASVHDEAISEIQEVDIKEDTLEIYNKLLCQMPTWADGLPLFAEGWIGKRYKK